MKRELTVSESDNPGLALIFHIGSPPNEPDLLSKHGAMYVEVKGDGPGSYLRVIGLYDTNEEAQRAAERYAVERGKAILKWELESKQSGRGSEPDLEAYARPAADP